MVEVDSNSLFTDLFDRYLNGTAVFTLTVKSLTDLKIDTGKLLFWNRLRRFGVVLAVCIFRFHKDVALVADRHVGDTRFKTRDDLTFTENKDERRAAHVGVNNRCPVFYFILD